MTDIGIRTRGDYDEFEKQLIEKLTSREKVEDLRRKLIPVIKEEINKAVGSVQDNFNPEAVGGLDLVGQLGIGVGGKPAFTKTDNAWKLLRVGDGIAKLSTKFQPRNLRRFGVISYKLSKNDFYNQRLTTYKSQRSRGGSTEIKWMQNFIMGIATPGYAFVEDGEQGFRENRSRTGLGHMVNLSNTNRFSIPRQQFSYPGTGERATFGKLEDSITDLFNSKKFKSKLASIISASLGG